MKVKELIIELQNHDPEVDIITEGCDCFGTPDDIVTLEEYFSKGRHAEHYIGNKNLILTRNEEV